MLVERYAASLLAVMERGTGDHHLARDLAQEAWIKIYRGLGSFEESRSFRPWLFTIACNHLRDAQRKAGRRGRQAPMEEFPSDFAAETDMQVEERDERSAIEAALARVPEPYRSALHLVDVLGLDYQEAAASLECGIGTVKSRVHRGRQAFRESYRAAAPLNKQLRLQD
ncbi:MAG: RNA polymerase sigma-70 factor (ECF subfamily) [Planctomycetota bacterium]|jgi:RNA polymerase sigma-70 factor (ECF subfamily)